MNLNVQEVDLFFYSIKQRNVSLVEAMLNQYGPDIFALRDFSGYTAAHWVCLKRNSEILSLIAPYEEFLNLPSIGGCTQIYPIHIACLKGNIECLEILLNAGIDLECQDDYGQTAIFFVIKNGNIDFFREMMSRVKVNIFHKDKDQNTCLHWSAYKGHCEITRDLLVLGLDPNAINVGSSTPLHLACKKGNIEVVRLLCKASNFDIEKEDQFGRTPLQIANQFKYYHIVAYLMYILPPSKIPSRDYKFKILSTVVNMRKKNFTFYVMFIILFSWVYPVYLLHLIPETYEDMPYLHYFFITIHSLTLIDLMCAVLMNPGYIKKNSIDYLSLVDRADIPWDTFSRICHTCKILRPFRAKHCRVCDRCVCRYDHHCPVILNCVGHRNKVPFFFLPVLVLINAVIFVYFCNEAADEDASFDDLWNQINSYSYYQSLIICILLSPYILMLIGQIISNVTMNEMLNLHRYEYLKNDDGTFKNPFSKGVLGNVLGFFHLKEDASYLSYHVIEI